MEKKYSIEIDGRIYRLSERAIQILKLKKKSEKPIEVLKMPQKFDVIKVEPVESTESLEESPNESPEKAPERIIKRRRRTKKN